MRGLARCRRVIAGLSLYNQRAERRERASTAGLEKADVAHVLQASGHDGLEESADKLDDVELGGAEACTAHFTIGDGDGAVFEAHDPAVGDSDPEDRGGEGGAGGVAMMIRLPVDVPGAGPDLWGEGRPQAGVAHGFLAQSAGAGGEGVDRDKEVGAGGPPGRAVL